MTHAAALVAQFSQLIPEGLLALFACILFVGGAFMPNLPRSSWGITALAGLLLALIGAAGPAGVSSGGRRALCL